MKRLVLAFVVLGLAPASSAQASRYQLRSGRCRHGFVRENRHGERWCVTATKSSANLNRGHPEAGVKGVVDGLEGFLYRAPRRARLTGQTLTFAIVDVPAGKLVASFKERDFTTCTLRVTTEGTTETIAPEAQSPHPACPLASLVAAPAAHRLVIFVRFRGTTNFASSTGEAVGAP